MDGLDRLALRGGDKQPGGGRVLDAHEGDGLQIGPFVPRRLRASLRERSPEVPRRPHGVRGSRFAAPQLIGGEEANVVAQLRARDLGIGIGERIRRRLLGEGRESDEERDEQKE